MADGALAFDNWLRSVDAILHQTLGVNTAAVGVSPDTLVDYYESGLSAQKTAEAVRLVFMVE